MFISYRRTDSMDDAARIYELLVERYGDRVFRDVDRLDPGVDFVDALDAALASSDVLLVLIGPDWLATGPGGRSRLHDRKDFVRAEIQAGLRHDLMIVPVLLRQATMPAPESLPVPIRALARRQAVTIDDRRWRYDVGRLIETIERAGRPEPEDGADPAPVAVRLPVQLSSFIGRAAELAEVQHWIATNRLVTLTGPGGTGKTRLAIEVADRQRRRFRDGVTFVPLAPVSDPALVAAAIAQAAGIEEDPRHSTEDTVIARLRDAQMLLVLDNLEQLPGAGVIIGRLLAACPGVSVLATSRAPLHLRGEQEYPVPPMAVPAAGEAIDDVLAQDAVRLFVDRAALVRPTPIKTAELPAVAAICRRLDGLPLAIELAAARVKLLGPPAILERLEARVPTLATGAADAPDRQRTLEATIAWSYDLVSERERDLLLRCSVFAGGASLEAVASVARGADRDADDDILELVASLVDQSLLYQRESVTGEPRIRMLQTIREFARARLSTDLAATASRAHAEYVLTWSRAAEPNLWGPDQQAWLARVEEEYPNIMAALDWTLDGTPESAGRAPIGGALAASLVRFWYVRGKATEGRARLDACLTRSDITDPAVRIRLENGAGLLARVKADVEAAEAHHRRALDLARRLGEDEPIALSLGNLGALLTGTGDIAAALPLLDESLERMRRVGDRRYLAVWLNNRGVLAHDMEDLETARSLHAEALEARREVGDLFGVATSLYNLAAVALDAGDVLSADRDARESLQLSHELGDTEGVAYCLEALAWIAGLRHDPSRSARLLGGAATIREALDAPVPASALPTHDRYVSQARAQVDSAAWQRGLEAGRAMSEAEVVAEATSVA